MIYQDKDFCPLEAEKSYEDNLNRREERMCPENMQGRDASNGTDNMTKNEMMKKITETEFALIDLNLFLDTHPDCKEALNLFTQLSATLKSLIADYEMKFGPLYASGSKNVAPFQWVEQGRKWPWEV